MATSSTTRLGLSLGQRARWSCSRTTSAEVRTPDLRIGYTDGRIGVGEVVTVTDQHRAAESRAFANGGLDLFGANLKWQWWVTAPATVDRRRVRASLLQVLEEMEAANERPPMLAPIDPAAAGPGGVEVVGNGSGNRCIPSQIDRGWTTVALTNGTTAQ